MAKEYSELVEEVEELREACQCALRCLSIDSYHTKENFKEEIRRLKKALEWSK